MPNEQQSLVERLFAFFSSLVFCLNFAHLGMVWKTSFPQHKLSVTFALRAKKIIFTACYSGKLKLVFTSPDIISTSPKTFWLAELISQFSCYSNYSKNINCPSGKLKTGLTSPMAKSTSPGLSDTTFFARCKWYKRRGSKRSRNTGSGGMNVLGSWQTASQRVMRVMWAMRDRC